MKQMNLEAIVGNNSALELVDEHIRLKQSKEQTKKPMRRLLCLKLGEVKFLSSLDEIFLLEYSRFY